MLINQVISGGKDYKATIRTRLTVAVALMVLGMTATVVAILFRDMLPNDFFRGVYSGAGSGLTLGGVIIFVTNLILLKNAEKANRKQIEETDERNAMIRAKSVCAAFYWGCLSMLVAALIAGPFSSTVFMTLLVSVGFLFALMVGSLFFYARKY